MKYKAIYKSLNPFIPDVSKLEYSKTVDIPDDYDLDLLEKQAKDDTMKGYKFFKLEKL